jgi:hypothetical protein
MEFDDLPFLENIKNMAKEYNSVLNGKENSEKKHNSALNPCRADNDCSDGYYKMRKKIYGNPYNPDVSDVRSGNRQNNIDILNIQNNQNNFDISLVQNDNRPINPDISNPQNDQNNPNISNSQSSNQLNNIGIPNPKSNQSNLNISNPKNNSNISNPQNSQNNTDISKNTDINQNLFGEFPPQDEFLGSFDGSENVLDDENDKKIIDFEPGFPENERETPDFNPDLTENDFENSTVDFDNQYDLSYLFPDTDEFGNPASDIEDRTLYEPQNYYPEENGGVYAENYREISDENGVPYINNTNQNNSVYPNQNGVSYVNPNNSNQNISAYPNQNGISYVNPNNPNQNNPVYPNQNGVSYVNPNNPNQNDAQNQQNNRILYNNQFNDYTPYRENSNGTDTKTSQGGAYALRNTRKPDELTSPKPVQTAAPKDGNNSQNGNAAKTPDPTNGKAPDPTNGKTSDPPDPTDYKNKNANNIQEHANMLFRYPQKTSGQPKTNNQDPPDKTSTAAFNNQTAKTTPKDPPDAYKTNNQTSKTNAQTQSNTYETSNGGFNPNNQSAKTTPKDPPDAYKTNNQTSKTNAQTQSNTYKTSNGGLNLNNKPANNSRNTKTADQNDLYSPRSDGSVGNGSIGSGDYRNLLFFSNNLRNVCIILRDQAALLTYMRDLTPDPKLRAQIDSLLSIKETSLKETDRIFGEVSPEKPILKRPTVSRGRYINAYNMLVSLQKTLDQNFEFLINNRLGESYINALSSLIAAENRSKAILKEIKR